MKTVACYNLFENCAQFIEFDGDLSRFDGIVINTVVDEDKEVLQEELTDLLFPPNHDKINATLLDKPPKEYDFWINIGFAS